MLPVGVTNRALADVQSTGAGIKRLYCMLSSRTFIRDTIPFAIFTFVNYKVLFILNTFCSVLHYSRFSFVRLLCPLYNFYFDSIRNSRSRSLRCRRKYLSIKKDFTMGKFGKLDHDLDYGRIFRCIEL